MTTPKCGAGGRAYWVIQIGEGWVCICLERFQLHLRAADRSARPNTNLSLNYWLAAFLQFENSPDQKPCTALYWCVFSCSRLAYKKPAVWAEARRNCQQEGATMAVVNSEQEAKVLRCLYFNYRPANIKRTPRMKFRRNNWNFRRNNWNFQRNIWKFRRKKSPRRNRTPSTGNNTNTATSQRNRPLWFSRHIYWGRIPHSSQ